MVDAHTEGETVIVYPTVEEVLYIEELLRARYGGSSKPCDLGLLESALVRPCSDYYRSIAERAAALLHSLSINRPFLYCDARAAFAITAVFIYANGYRLLVMPDEAEPFMQIQVMGGRASMDDMRKWLEGYLVPAT